MSKAKTLERENFIRHKSLGKRIMEHWEFYLLLLPAVVLTIIFKYVPIYGLQIAFRDFVPSNGIWGSEWVGLKWFEKFFNSYNSWRMISNTILLSVEQMLWTFPIPIVLALMLNQVRHKGYRNVVQTITYAPHFISIMVLAGMLRMFLSPSGGLINLIIQAFGGEPVFFLGDPSAFRPTYVISSIWQDSGWGTIIYLATLAGVDTQLYDAAKVDGAGTIKRILHIDLPTLAPTIIIMLIMSFGNLMNVGFEKAFLLQTDLNKGASDIIATYVYTQGILKGQYSFSTAVGLFNTVINVVLLLIVNKIAKKVSDTSFI